MSRAVITKLLSSRRPLVFGMIHVPALPGTPNNNLSIDKIRQKVREEASVYIDCNVDGIIIENMHDLPYCKPPAAPEVVAAMTLACDDVSEAKQKRKSNTYLGVQILAAANREALGVAHSTGLDFIRAEGFIYGHVADEGWTDACAGSLVRYRKQIGAENVAIITDIKKKHSAHSVTSDVPITDMAKDAEFNLADGVIVTGSATGQAANLDELHGVIASTKMPVLVGSGVDNSSIGLYRNAHGLVIGSSFKKGGHWKEDLDPLAIRKTMQIVSQLSRKDTSR